jgi:hypothetical protein
MAAAVQVLDGANLDHATVNAASALGAVDLHLQ